MLIWLHNRAAKNNDKKFQKSVEFFSYVIFANILMVAYFIVRYW